MGGALNTLASFWVGLFPWIVYPLRVIFAAVLAVFVIRVILRWVIPLLGRLTGRVGPILSRRLCSLLLYPELLWANRLVRLGRPFPILLRRYGAAAEDLTDLFVRGWALAAGAMQAGARTGKWAPVAVVAAVILLVNVPGVADGGSSEGEGVPMTSWWKQVGAWVEGSPDVEETRERGK